MRQKIAQIGVQTAGDVVTVGVVIFLVLAWMLTSPFIQLFDQFAGRTKVRANNK